MLKFIKNFLGGILVFSLLLLIPIFSYKLIVNYFQFEPMYGSVVVIACVLSFLSCLMTEEETNNENK